MVGVVIPTHNRCASLCRTLANLSQLMSEGDEVRLYVVADDCSDDTLETIPARFPEVRLLQGSGPALWWTGSINLGAEAAFSEGAQWVLLFNDDIQVDPECLRELLKVARSVPGSIVGPKILEMHTPQRLFSAGGLVDWYRSGAGAYMRATETLDGPHLDGVRVVKWLPGMGTLIPRSAWQTLGGLDASAFPQYMSDCDLGLRASKLGIPVLFCPSARLYNDVAQTAEQVPPLSKLWPALWSPYFHGSFPVRLTFLSRHCPLVLLPYRVVRFYAWLILRSLQRSWRERR